MLALITSRVGAQPKANGSFESMWDCVRTATDGGLPLRTQMFALNKARVALKHHGVVPDRASARDAVSAAEGFVEDVSVRIFGVDFWELSMLDALDPEHRWVPPLRQAEESTERATVAQATAIALAELEEHVARDASPRPSPSLPARQSMKASAGGSDDEYRFLDERIRALEVRSALAGLGIDMVEYDRIKSELPYVHLTPSGPLSGEVEPTLTLEDVRLHLAFVIEIAVLLDMARPNGT